MVKIPLLITAMLVLAVNVHSQVSDHQRIGVEKETHWSVGMDVSSSLTTYETQAGTLYDLDEQVSMDFVLQKTWSFSATVPMRVNVLYDLYKTPLSMDIGDIDVSLGYTGRIKDIRCSLRTSILLPTGNAYAIPEGAMVTGGGRWCLGVNASASFILDPVLLGIGFGYQLGLPRKERFGSSWNPGDFTIGLSVAEVLNDAMGYSLRLTQTLSIPTSHEGVSLGKGLDYQAGGAVEFFFSKKNWSVRVGFSKSITSILQPASVSLSYSLSIDSEQFKKPPVEDALSQEDTLEE